MASKAKKGKLKDIDLVLAALYLFLHKRREEVSLPELTECVAELEKLSVTSYHFPKGLFYSSELFSDLRTLQCEGYVHRYEYTHDAFLPKTYYKLTMLGQGKGGRLFEALSEDQSNSLESAVETSISNNEKRWRLVARTWTPSRIH